MCGKEGVGGGECVGSVGVCECEMGGVYGEGCVLV